jgi:hypothetical protein
MAKAQKGMIPLPIIIPPNKSYDFDYVILFMPFDKKTTIINHQDSPFKLYLHASIGNKPYKKIAEQNITSEDIVNLTNGSLSSLISTSTTENRQKFFNVYMP